MVSKRIKVTTFKDGQCQGEVVDLGYHELEIREIQMPPTGNLCISSHMPLVNIGKTALWAVVGSKAYLIRETDEISILPADKEYLNRHCDHRGRRVELNPGPPDKDGYYTGRCDGRSCKIHSTYYHQTELVFL